MINSADPDQKPTDLDLHCFAKTGHVMFSKRRVNKYRNKGSIYLTILISEHKVKKP